LGCCASAAGRRMVASLSLAAVTTLSCGWATDALADLYSRRDWLPHSLLFWLAYIIPELVQRVALVIHLTQLIGC
jgi:hypothetical protein